MKKKKIIGTLLILVPFIGLQFASYYGSYLETNSWAETFEEKFNGTFVEIIIHHIWILIGVVILIRNIDKNRE